MSSGSPGADIRWLDFSQVVFWPHPDVLRLFIERGADTQTGYPIAEGLTRAPRAFLGLYKEFIDRHPDWQLQANIALRHFCREGSMRGVCLLLWLKADPRAKVTSTAGEAEDLWASGLWEACITGHSDIVRKIGPTPEKDNLDDLPRLACSGQSVELVEYLVGLGANPNAAPATGETALRSSLCALEWRLDFNRHELYRAGHHQALAVLRRLVELGARLSPAVTDELRLLRRCLLKLEWPASYDLVKLLHQHRFSDEAVMIGLLKEPKMRAHLQARLPALARLFPVLKKWVGA